MVRMTKMEQDNHGYEQWLSNFVYRAEPSCSSTGQPQITKDSV